jgi:Ca2+:H+ antiporter
MNLSALLRPSSHWLLFFIPVAITIDHMGTASPPVVFFSAALAIVPVAHLISQSTEHLSGYTGDAVGGLLNATFGNLPELIIALVALKAGLYQMVAASLVGAILFNLLLALGFSFLLGGLRFHTQRFNDTAASVYSSMMFIAVMSLALPSLYAGMFAEASPLAEQESLNVALAIMLLALYALYLLFMVRTHPKVFAAAEESAGGTHETHWSLARCVGTLVAASIVAAVMSEILVGAVEGTGEALGLSAPFIGIVLLASVGGAAEGISAVAMARQNRMDITLSISLGSCIQLALFVAPVLVFASYLVGPRPFHLLFKPSAVALLLLAVLIGSIVASRGQGNWYKGVQLIAVYLMIALMLYFVPL